MPIPRRPVGHRAATLILVGSALCAQNDTTPPREKAWDEGYRVADLPAVLPERDRAAAINRMLRDRLDNLLPRLMREQGLDMWLVINREYNEDPVYLTLVPEPVFAARRTTILVFFDRGESEGIERLTVSRYGLGDYYQSAWDGGSAEEQWKRLADLIRERNPERIGVNTSEHWAVGDGLSSGLRQQLENALGDDSDRLVPAAPLCVRWFETRSKMELEVYPQIVQLARGVIAEAFSNRVITPGATKAEDVRWWIRQRFTQLGLPVWFQPYCNVQRLGALREPDAPFYGENDAIIQRGDVLHTDVGITYLRLNTDTQEMAYVLRAGERDVPDGLRRAMAVGNRWQDILCSSFREGLTGNQILAATRELSASEGILCSVYTHPLGFFGHAPGPTIGMWDNQGPTPIRGDWPLHPDTAYAIEGNIKVRVPEWDDQWVQIKLEQDAWFDGNRVTYLGGRQTEWHVIR